MKSMKKLCMLIIVLLLLTACGTNASDVDVIDDSGEAPEYSETQREELRGDFADNALSPALQLVVGSLLMGETDLAVDMEQAENLLPYWKLYITLTESDTTAPEELEAIIKEIELFMTADQINYIVDLELTQESMFALIDELGIMEDLRSEGDGTGANRPEGLPAGTSPGGGQGRSGGVEGMDPEMVATLQARREEEGGGLFGGSRLVVPLVEHLISELEELIES